jgi:hypothetical protein
MPLVSDLTDCSAAPADLGLSFPHFLLDKMLMGSEVQAELRKSTGQTHLPYVFVW